MTRTIPPPAPRSHLDFLHPARNLSRLRLGSVRLSQLERHVLGWNRSADLVSEMIPSIYLDFVRYWYADPLVPVFQEHNQMDLRGLAGLSGRILALLGEEETSQDGLELYGVSRICERCGEMKPARKLYEQSIASTLPAETDRAARRALARPAKRDGDLALARELWKSALGNSREGYEAYEQLAIYFEHEAREPRQALVIAREALTELRRANQVGMIAPPAYRRTKASLSTGWRVSSARPDRHCSTRLTLGRGLFVLGRWQRHRIRQVDTTEWMRDANACWPLWLGSWWRGI